MPRCASSALQYLGIVGAVYGLVRPRAGIVLRLARRRAHVLAAGRQRGPVRDRGAGRLGLRAWLQAPASGVFFVVAISLAVYGLIIAAAIKFGSWTR